MIEYRAVSGRQRDYENNKSIPASSQLNDNLNYLARKGWKVIAGTSDFIILEKSNVTQSTDASKR